MIQRRGEDFKTSDPQPELAQSKMGTNSLGEVKLQTNAFDGHVFAFNERNDVTDTPNFLMVVRGTNFSSPLHTEFSTFGVTQQLLN
jgi:hypothetical protein